MFPTTIASLRQAAHDRAKLALDTGAKLVGWQLAGAKRATSTIEDGLEIALSASRQAVEGFAPKSDEA